MRLQNLHLILATLILSLQFNVAQAQTGSTGMSGSSGSNGTSISQPTSGSQRPTDNTNNPSLSGQTDDTSRGMNAAGTGSTGNIDESSGQYAQMENTSDNGSSPLGKILMAIVVVAIVALFARAFRHRAHH